MVLGKTDFEEAKKIRRGIINEILNDSEVLSVIRNYLPSKKESPWIPKAIAWRSRIFLEFVCNRRAKEVIRMRRGGKV